MYYGNASVTAQQNKTAVWDENTKMVQHLSESPANGVRGHYDSTQYENDGNPYNFTGSETSTTDAEGYIAGADIFNGGDGYDYVGCGNDESLDITEKLTLEAWIRVDANASYQSIVGKGDFSSAYWFAVNPTVGHMTFYLDGVSDYNSYGASVLWNIGEWSHVVATYDSTAASGNMRIYVDGILKGSQTVLGAITSTTGDINIGNNSFYAFNGAIDEVRISNTARSVDWIVTEYNNQSSPSTFLSLASEQSYMNHFSLSGTSTHTAGNAQTITLTAINTYDSTNTTYTGDKTITMTGANTVDSNPPTFTDKDGVDVPFGSPGIITFTNGTATTAIKLYKAETAGIHITDGTYLSSADFDITVSPGIINSFSLTAPSFITSEEQFQLTFTAKDIYTNTTTDISNDTVLSINDGTISLASIGLSEFTDDGIYIANITISDIAQDKTIILAINNGSISQTQGLSIRGVSYGSSFISPQKPDISDITITDEGGYINLKNLSSNITHIAISSTPDFNNSSWEPIESKDNLLKQYTDTNLYIRLRTKQGATSDTITHSPLTLNEGDMVKTPNNFDVYIIKYKGGNQYKRLILSPSVFNSYQHLRWENIKTISQEQLDLYTTSNLVQVATDDTIYELTPMGDTGTKKMIATYNNGTLHLNQDEAIIDMDSIYEINATDKDSYILE
ncbi:MAG: LamG domain-containing protein [Candidatus Pacebacteria bacterium]|nr:LamG domain-containing protein [Candidatus Paceibacterota bacterium]